MYGGRTMISMLIAALSHNFNGTHIITLRRSSNEPDLVGTYVKQKLTYTWSKRSKKRIATKRTSPPQKLISKMRMPTMRKTATFRKK